MFGVRTSSFLALMSAAVKHCTKSPAMKRCGRRLCFASSMSCVRSKSTAPKENVVDSPYSDIEVPQTSLPDFIWAGMEKWHDKTAVECGLTGKAYTYAQLREMCLRLAASLLKMGLKPGDTVSVILPNLPEYPIIVLGSMEAGLVVSTTNPIYTPDEMGHQVKCSSLIFTHPLVLPSVFAMQQKIKSRIPIVCLDTHLLPELPPGIIAFADLIQEGIDTSAVSSVSQRINADDTAYRPYSSGTSGLPKGVCLSHKNISVNVCQVDHPDMSHVGAHPPSKDQQDVVPGILPFFHIYGTTLVMFQCLKKGAKLVTLPKFEPEYFLEILKNNKEIVMHAVPPMILFLGAHPDVKKEHLEPIKAILVGGAPCASFDIERVQNRKPIPILQAYGMTEASPALAGPPLESKDTASIGSPVTLTQAKVIDWDTGKSLPAGEVGELCFRGPQVMKGYHNLPEATADILDEDGWLHTGDIGYYNENKHFYIVDRLKELIKIKGFQVPPAELEAVLRQHPHIMDSGVAGVPCPQSGEKAVAFVVPKVGAPQLNPKEILAYVSERVAPYKRLSKVIITDEIPKNAAGKILRRELRERATS